MRILKIFLTILLSIICSSSLWACPTTLGSLIIKDPVIIFYKGNVPGAGYLTIHQTGSSPDKLLKVRLSDQIQSTAPGARIELHNHVPVETDGQLIMQMVALDSIKISPAADNQPSVVEFKQGGMHLMLYNVPDNLKNAEKIALVLTFEKAGEVTVSFKINKGLKNNCSCPHGKD